jgi:carbamoylphosphate synthase small subunit
MNTILVYDPYSHGHWIDGYKKSSFDNADIVVLPGGADLEPSLYGHEKISRTFCFPQADKEELVLVNRAIDSGKFIVGTCRGAQLLTARAGGWLIQHVTGHGGNHPIQTFDGKELEVTSTHHQMCYPYDLPENEYELLGWAKSRSATYLIQGEEELYINPNDSRIVDQDDGLFKEPEVIWYPKIRGLAFQMHNEYRTSPVETNAWANEQILRLM